jgi:hypothetical protein
LSSPQKKDRATRAAAPSGAIIFMKPLYKDVSSLRCEKQQLQNVALVIHYAIALQPTYWKTDRIYGRFRNFLDTKMFELP